MFRDDERLNLRETTVLLVTGMSGAGKSTVLRTLEDSGWEVVDNMPLRLLERLLDASLAGPFVSSAHPLAIGIDTRTREFEPSRIIVRTRRLIDRYGPHIKVLFLDCAGKELERRYSETRRRHPLALDRPASGGIMHERNLLAPLKAFADQLIDTTGLTASALAMQLRSGLSDSEDIQNVVSLISFGYANGLPAGADLVFDMRFLRNPHWNAELRSKTGLDPDVMNYITEDPAYDEAVGRVQELLGFLIPQYRASGKTYVTIAFGCTGGRHRSVHIAERIGALLRSEGFSLTVNHRDLTAIAKQSGNVGRIES